MKLMCASQIDLRKRRAIQALITDIFLECIHSVLSVTFLSLDHTHRHKCANYFHILVSLRYVFAYLANTCTCDL